MIGLTKRLRSLGFIADVPKTIEGKNHYYYQAYIKDLSANTSLIVEGFRRRGYSTYRFSFYKTTFIDNGRKINEKVYLENASPLEVLQRVTSYINYMERSS